MTEQQEQAPTPADVANQTTPPANPDRGFPEKTPIADMTAEQQAAYWKHHARKHEEAVNAYGGLTPDQVREQADRLQALEREQMDANDRAVAEARDAALAEARKQAEGEFLPKLHATQMEAAAGQILNGDQLSAFLAVADPAKFLNESGDVDKEAVVGHLTAMYAGAINQQFGNGLPQHRNWGQHQGQSPATSPADLGRAEAERRYGKRNS